jgi:hypothetical protein
MLPTIDINYNYNSFADSPGLNAKHTFDMHLVSQLFHISDILIT